MGCSLVKSFYHPFRGNPIRGNPYRGNPFRGNPPYLLFRLINSINLPGHSHLLVFSLIEGLFFSLYNHHKFSI